VARAELRGRSGKGLGFTDDRVRLALARATLREGKSVADWNIAAEIAAEAAGIEAGKLLERAKSPVSEKRVRASTAEFRALQITQRPAFVIDTEIGDRAIFLEWSNSSHDSDNRFNA